MADHTQLIDAVNIRTATRAYDGRPLDDDTARQLEMAIEPLNLLAGLDMQLVRDRPGVFADAAASGHLTGARDFVALVGPDDAESRERAGFYGERLVLTATLRGLGTLWVAGSWDRAAAERQCRLPSGQVLYLAIVVGTPADAAERMSLTYDELCARQRDHRPTLGYEGFTAPMDDEERRAAPDWFRAGVEAAMKAPSARNTQPVRFSYDPADGTASATVDPAAGDGPNAANDLGIAKLHFQIGAGRGSWQWGDGGRFTRG